MKSYVNKTFNVKKIRNDQFMRRLFQLCAILASSFIILIIVFIAMKGIKPFLPSYEYGQQDFLAFISGSVYRKDQNLYGIGFIIINTLITTLSSLVLAFPISVLSALYIVKMAPKQVKEILKTVVELLASIPSVVYGVFALGSITVLVDNLASLFNVTSYGGSSLLAVVLLLAIMIYPTITSMSISAIESVDKDLELGSLALGATKTQTNFKVVLTSAKSGIFAGAILGVGRAFGEATAVAMVCGNKMFGPTFNLFDITRTLTTTMLSGLKETTGLDYDIRFSIGLVLMVIILATNLLLNYLKKKVGKMS